MAGENVNVLNEDAGGVLQYVTLHLRAADRPFIAGWLLSVADHPWDVASQSVGYKIPGSLWEKQVAGKSVGDWLQEWEVNPEGGLPEPMSDEEIAEAQERAQAPDDGSTPAQADEGQADEPARKAPARAKAKG